MGTVGRRRFLIAAGGLALAPIVSKAQQPVKLPKVGYLGIGTPDDGASYLAAFRSGLAALGQREGRTIVIDVRWALRNQERLATLADELVHESKVDVLVIGACGKQPIQAARRASQTVPLVVASCGDLPGFMGEVASLTKPGGNTTGQTAFAPELSAKRLELLKNIVPTLSVAAVLWNPNAGAGAWDPYWKAMRPAAAVLGITLQSVEVLQESDFNAAFKNINSGGASALLTLVDAFLWTQRERIIDFALTQRLPAAYDLERFALDGGLLAYGTDLLASFRGAAGQVDKILKGVKPGDIPIERPAKFRLVVNLKTAKALGLTIPHSIILGADRVIE